MNIMTVIMFVKSKTDNDVISLTNDCVTSLTDAKVTLLISIDDDDNFTSLTDIIIIYRN